MLTWFYIWIDFYNLDGFCMRIYTILKGGDAGAWRWSDWTIWRSPVRAGEARGDIREIQRDILDGSACMRRPFMSSFSFLPLRFCRTCLSAARLSTSSYVILPVTVGLRYHTETMSPTSTAIQKMAYSAVPIVGQSGCIYSIERVLQEKEIPPRRVYLAT